MQVIRKIGGSCVKASIIVIRVVVLLLDFKCNSMTFSCSRVNVMYRDSYVQGK